MTLLEMLLGWKHFIDAKSTTYWKSNWSHLTLTVLPTLPLSRPPLDPTNQQTSVTWTLQHLPQPPSYQPTLWTPVKNKEEPGKGTALGIKLNRLGPSWILNSVYCAVRDQEMQALFTEIWVTWWVAFIAPIDYGKGRQRARFVDRKWTESSE